MLFTFDHGLLKTMVQKKRRVGAESDIKGLAKWRMGVELEDGLAAAQIETRQGGHCPVLVSFAQWPSMPLEKFLDLAF